MNTKETQQVMKNNEQYMSLYDYRGISSRESGLGQKVYEAAKKKDVHVIYQDLPPDLSRPEYNRVATYPKSFLDEYFGNTISTNMSIHDVYLHLVELKKQFDQLISNLESDVADNVEQDDDLPF
jgi:hypothetical protein